MEIIEVNRQTQERTPRPSGRCLAESARANELELRSIGYRCGRVSGILCSEPYNDALSGRGSSVRRSV